MNEQDRSTHGNEVTIVEIRIKGHLDARWADWFADLTIALQENGDTLLTGPVADQAALHGLLRNVRDLGMPLLSVASVAAGQSRDSPEESSGPLEEPDGSL